MATSGTVGTTTLDVAQTIEHAFRRCGKVASTITQEQLQIARDNLFLLLTSMANRGLNLWTIEKDVIQLESGKAVYTLEDGTIDVLHAFYRPYVLNTDYIVESESYYITSFFTQDPPGPLIGSIGLNRYVELSAAEDFTLNVYVEYDSGDALSFDLSMVSLPNDGTTLWIDLDPVRTVQNITFTVPFDKLVQINFYYAMAGESEVVINRINRDDYTNLPDKYSTGIPTQFWLDRQLTPEMRIWPVAQDDVSAFMIVWKQRQVMDVGSLTDTLEVPTRWLESIIWQLALRICFEVPEINPDRIKMVTEMAGKYEFEAESEEYDNSPVYLAPNINPYTQ